MAFDENNCCILRVVGKGDVAVVADTLLVKVQASVLEDTGGEAQTKVNSIVALAIEKAKTIGIDDSAITTADVSIHEASHWKNEERIVDGWRASQSLEIKSHDVCLTAPLVDALSSVDGLELSNIKLDVEDRDRPEGEARRLAVLNARKKAEDYAAAAGMHISCIKSMSEEDACIDVPLFAGPRVARMSASTDFRPEDINVTASIVIEFVLV